MAVIKIVGLGAGELEQLPLGIYNMLTRAKHVFLRTKEHPVVGNLEAEGMTYTSFDHVYEEHDQFEDVYEAIVQTLLEESKDKEIIYAVPGHPFVAERTVQLLVEKEADIDVQGGQSFLDPLFASLQIDPIEGFQFVDATSFVKEELQLRHHLIFCQVYDNFIASEVKLALMDRFLPDDYDVYIVTAAGTSFEEIKKVPLYMLDHEAELNNLTSVYIPPVLDDSLLYQEFTTLRQIIATLRGPNGCPWDKEQTNESLKKYLIEEAYELLDAIDEEDDEHIVEELGDVLLQVMLHAQIGEDEGWFSIDEVIQGLSEKMVRRHPHVFGGREVTGTKEVVANWNEIKKEEKGEPASILASIPTGLPGLMKAYELQKKAAKVGFDWDDVAPMMQKVEEELREFIQERESGSSQERMAGEFGDLLFALVNVARYYQIDPEEAIRMTCKKFMRRFSYIEECVAAQGYKVEEMTLEQLDAFWEEAKKEE
ncbi:nucleoside triphosphate pyrophosphohydrolase [Priestia taiwanensis]|uniref:MazG family protein n=1 Tax=Priestia taiwanensis TaxID=1347902 RepID=A0A917AYC7_9BACI|nr:nucleoside triphosphate pyrophosphohydrolase [Priestia taiwanensis]MBM7365174.1 tetrapyrrole methylase family protein/MazG family protein [Priestia taiwanensis]GGE84703.1 MazG family protein [Priestia taiwanensis]